MLGIFPNFTPDCLSVPRRILPLKRTRSLDFTIHTKDTGAGSRSTEEQKGMAGAKDFSLFTAIFGILLTSSIIIDAATVTAEPSIHDILTKYGLPVGLLPDSVKTYSLSEDGHFVVELDKPCYVQFNYLVYYDKTIEGVLKYGEITDLSGIQAKELFIWVHVTGIKVDLPSSNYIYFQVGLISKKIEISWFDTVPSCRSNGKKSCNEIQPSLAERDIQ